MLLVEGAKSLRKIMRSPLECVPKSVRVKLGHIPDSFEKSESVVDAMHTGSNKNGIVQKVSDLVTDFRKLFKKEKVTKIKKERMPFEHTTEGKRRQMRSAEDIKAEVESLFKEACDEYEIPEQLRPKMECYSDASNFGTGGGYYSSKHAIRLNEAAYRRGVFDLPNVIKHEVTHAHEAILRQRLPMEEKQEMIVKYLLDKIQNGDKEYVLTGEVSFLFGDHIKVKYPKMNKQMKADFSKLAQDKLYKLTNYSQDEMISMVRPLVESNPEFISMYESVDDAVNAIVGYAKNQNYRYKLAMNQASGFNTSGIDTSLLKGLSEEERQIAANSYRDGVNCLESNAANQGLFGGDFEQYQFTPEEVLAQQRGNNFEITKLEKQLKKLRATKNYDLAEEARLLDEIERCKLTIKYKTKGEEMYKLKVESTNHPENEELAKKVNSLKCELWRLEGRLKSFGEASANGVFANEYSTYQVMQRPIYGKLKQKLHSAETFVKNKGVSGMKAVIKDIETSTESSPILKSVITHLREPYSRFCEFIGIDLSEITDFIKKTS